MNEKNIMDSRRASFIVLALVYALAALVGVAVYRALDFGWQVNMLIADIAATVATFIFSLAFKNASVYDPYWSVQPVVILVAFAADRDFNLLRTLLMIAVCFWGVRLTANWAYTFHGLRHQDWRYTMLKEKTGVFYPVINFIGIHMVPTLVVYGCTLPAAHAFVHDSGWNAGNIAFFLLSVGAACMQGVADIQMHAFRKNRNGKFIRNGLWKHSRHPNYLGEILMWWGIGLSVVCAFPKDWYLLAGAAANTLLFLCVSIPLADGRQSAKDGWQEYKKATRMLLPIRK